MTKLIRFLTVSMAIAFILTIVSSDFRNFINDYVAIEEGTLRMHILANSDSEEDQSVKLKVRDALLKLSEKLFGESKTKEEAKKSAEEHKDEIESAANAVLLENGFDYGAKCEIVKMEFDERFYDNITMPAGTYDAVRVTLGNADGQNWWCIMYPELCLPTAEIAVGPAAVSSDGEYVDADYERDDGCFYTESQRDILENPDKYVIKFKTVEVWGKVKKWWQNIF